MIRILINCPGGWSHGLDSPERGEGRWAQNLAKLLGRSGRYEVFASSGGNPEWGRGEKVPVVLLAEPEAAKESYDIYLDSSWYQGKPAVAEARAYLHVYWGAERWMLADPLPPSHFLVYVYRQSATHYLCDENVNRSRTYYLPATFGPAMVDPDPYARRILSFSRSTDTPEMFRCLYAAVTRLRQEGAVPLVWIDSGIRRGARHPQDVALTHPDQEPWGIPYCEQLAFIRGAGLNASFGGGGSIADCAVHGVPSLIREDNFDFVASVARAHELLLPVDCPTEGLEAAIRRLFGDPALYTAYTRALQEEYRDHLDAKVLDGFEAIVGRVL